MLPILSPSVVYAVPPMSVCTESREIMEVLLLSSSGVWAGRNGRHRPCRPLLGACLSGTPRRDR
jgi:hypothetical protein